MPHFRCVPIATETAARFRRTGMDDRGNTLRRVVAEDGGGYPCRHCLCSGLAGEVMLLGSYDLVGPKGIYWTPSPIFLHEAVCSRFEQVDAVAPIIGRGTLVSVRAYDAEDLCLYALGQVCDGADVDAPLARALGDPRTAFVNVHTARPGCLLARVERVALPSPLQPSLA